MLSIFRTIFDWSEVWALLMPLTVLLILKPKSNWVQPMKWYLITALLLNVSIDFMWYINKYDLFNSKPGHRWNNNIFYNLHSVARLLFFSWFFSTQGKKFYSLTRLLPVIFIFVFLVFFIFSGKSILNISSYLLASEAGLLLFFCLWYTNSTMRDTKSVFNLTHPPYWIVGGLTVYTAVNFFIFLFYNYLMKNYKDYSINVWDIHNILFIILCLCISIAFYYEPNRK